VCYNTSMTTTTSCSIDTHLDLAFANGQRDAQAREDARPGCPTSPRGRAYMRGYLSAFENGENS
jgi:hypothetical protein